MNQYNPSQARPGFRPQSAVDARAAFIVRTYAHVFAAIVAFTLLEVAYFQTGVVVNIAQLFLGTGWLGMLLFFGGMIGSSMLAQSFAANLRSVPMQYAGLGIFVVAESLLFAPLLLIAEMKVPGGGIIASAAGVALVGFAGLSAVAFVTRKDFSFLRGVIMWGFLMAMLLVVASLIFGFHLGVMFSVALVALSGAAILYDTSNIIHHWDTRMHVAAALQLFASVMIFFWYILRIFIASRD